MQIEEAFRDLKSTRFGLSLELHRTYQLERLQVLLLIATLALMVAWTIGKATQHTGQHPHYQANTVRDGVVLSTIFLGLAVIDDPRVSLSFADVIGAINSLHETLQKHLPGWLTLSIYSWGSRRARLDYFSIEWVHASPTTRSLG
jgi:hypothetical protein